MRTMFAFLVAVRATAAAAAAGAAATAAKPHIFFCLVDDLGHADVGFTDGPPSVETVTPTLDTLVQQGVRLERHYVHYTCTPTRSSIHSGRLPVRVTTELSSPPAPNAGIPRNYTGMAEVLLGLYPIVTSQYSSTTLYQVSYHLR